MFDFEKANDDQRNAITCTEGPLLIIAGPGTGKTYTLVKRTLYLIMEKKVKPEEIMIVTFTEKAAKEIITRITDEVNKLNIDININEMYIGTFHSICLRILKENVDYVSLKKNYRVIDGFEQQYIIYQNLNKFNKIDNFIDLEDPDKGSWRISQEIADYVNVISEELIDYNDLKKDSDLKIKIIGRIIEIYNDILGRTNYLDFTRIQTEAYNLLKNNSEILNKLRSKVKYVMVDEYQDTNYIQEQLTFLIAGEEQNICVVGDDDQGLYRFRGATIRNIIEFPKKFENGKCKQVHLTINYRSEKQIIDFYNKWMNSTKGKRFEFAWDKFRYPKTIQMGKSPKNKTLSVIKVAGVEDDFSWYEQALKFINILKTESNLENLNQIAFLFNSVRNNKVIEFANFLEENGINVYSPRSNMFFQRKEIKTIIGLYVLMFPAYAEKLNSIDYRIKDDSIFKYYEECVSTSIKYISQNEELKKFMKFISNKHLNLMANTDYAFTGLLYKLFEYEPFSSWLNCDLNSGIKDQRTIRNISLFSQMISKFDYLHHLDVLTPQKMDKNVETLFNTYMRFLIEGGMCEYEDEKEYAPSGCVLFSTVHQAKGMEFPIVFVDSLGNIPIKKQNDILIMVEERYSNRKAFEPLESIKYFDFWRLYYTAFSRAQDLLILGCAEKEYRKKRTVDVF